jgi:hypothetical protein
MIANQSTIRQNVEPHASLSSTGSFRGSHTTRGRQDAPAHKAFVKQWIQILWTRRRPLATGSILALAVARASAHEASGPAIAATKTAAALWAQVGWDFLQPFYVRLFPFMHYVLERHPTLSLIAVVTLILRHYYYTWSEAERVARAVRVLQNASPSCMLAAVCAAYARRCPDVWHPALPGGEVFERLLVVVVPYVGTAYATLKTPSPKESCHWLALWGLSSIVSLFKPYANALLGPRIKLVCCVCV